MATVGQVYYNVIDKSSGNYISNVSGNLDIYSNIVQGYSASKFTKLGVQAKPGTRFVINETKTIMIGATGTYELDEDIAITSLYFLKPLKYTKDEEASGNSIHDGLEIILGAEQLKANKLKNLNQKYGGAPNRPGNNATESEKDTYNNYWNEYSDIQTEFIRTCQIGLDKYTSGQNGIYVLDPTDKYEDLYNVIIDFWYE